MTVFKFRNLKNGQATPIPQGEFTVGRADDTYIHLDDASVSRRHAMISNQENGLFVEDLDSANGTAAHGSYLTQRVQIGFGDIVYFGSVPFRVDPEVSGEAEVAPSAGMRTLNRSYMRRETERLPAKGSVLRSAEALSSEQLSAPQVNPDTDQDAGDLNAITMREPEVRPVQPSGFPPGAKASAQVKPVRTAISLPVSQPQRQVFSQPQPGGRLPHPVETEQRLAPVENTPPVSPLPAPTSDRTNWEWLLLSFLAGLGTGLLLALYFTKLFIEMGGKTSSLP